MPPYRYFVNFRPACVRRQLDKLIRRDAAVAVTVNALKFPGDERKTPAYLAGREVAVVVGAAP